MIARRHLLRLLAGTGACVVAAPGVTPLRASGLSKGFHVSLDGASLDLRPDTDEDQSAALQALFDAAARGRRTVRLPAGDYRAAGLVLPDGLMLEGGGQARLRLSGPGPLLLAREASAVTLSGLTIDGADAPGREAVEGLVDLRGVAQVEIEGVTVSGGTRHGLFLERCGGRIAGNQLAQAGQSGLFAVDSTGLSITDNTVSDCGNGGILVHRWEKGEDGTIVSGNRIRRIRADDGGTGENGNGINIYRAGAVLVTGNHISDCAFSAIRANAGDDVSITANHCLRSGETAIYSEFGFAGAIVSHNLIDGAANGILIVNFNEGGRLATVTGNLVRTLRETGPYIHDGAGFGFGIAVEADTVVSGNVIEDAPKWGLMLGWGPYMRNLVASGNLVRRAGAGCAVTVVEGAGTALIADNLFQAVGAGILGYRWNDKATGDLLSAGEAERFAHLTLSNNRLAPE